MMEAQLRAFKLFPEVTFIPGVWPDYGVAILSAFGCRIFWTPNGMPQVRGEILQCEDDLNSLEIPNPQSDGLMPFYLNTLKLFVNQKDDFKDTLHFTWSFGPGEIATYLCGISNFFFALIKKKRFALGVLEKVTQAIITWIYSQLEINPQADGLLLTDDISGMISKNHYEEFILPFHKKIREEFPDLIIVFHNDAKSNHILTSIVETGFEVFNFGKTTDILKCRESISERICLMGNLDPLELMINGSADEVYEKAIECLSLFSGHQGYILSVGGGLNRGVPVENIHALIAATKEFHE
jgi:uroporphyrinogen decarboxylase